MAIFARKKEKTQTPTYEQKRIIQLLLQRLADDSGKYDVEACWILFAASIISRGAAINPIRQPVIANVLLNPSITITRSRIVSNEAILTC